MDDQTKPLTPTTPVVPEPVLPTPPTPVTPAMPVAPVIPFPPPPSMPIPPSLVPEPQPVPPTINDAPTGASPVAPVMPPLSPTPVAPVTPPTLINDAPTGASPATPPPATPAANSKLEGKGAGKYKVRVIADKCIGAASCVAVAPKAFKLNDQQIAEVLPSIGTETDENLLLAAQSCPTLAIEVIDTETGEKVWPK
jgi:ferredoxin